MKDIQSIVKEVAVIYRKSKKDAEEYLRKARRLKERFGLGLAIIYCWFYSVPQKWIQVEPKIFKVMKRTNYFDLDTMSKVSKEELATTLNPMIFYNEISIQLKNFCKAIQGEYDSWEGFAEATEKQDIFSIFKKLRKHGNIRLTFKNLAAMKSFVGQSDNFPILDTHVANFLGISKETRNRFIVQETLFKKLLFFSSKVTQALRKEGFKNITVIQWSLAIWFNKTEVGADELLTNIS